MEFLKIQPASRIIKSEEIAHGLREALGLPLRGVLPNCPCPCGATLHPESARVHIHTCVNAASTYIIHNEVGRALTSIYASIPGVSVQTEVPNCPAPGCRMDLVVSGLPGMSGRRLLVDHTITHPARASILHRTATVPAFAAEEKQTEKIAKYSNKLIPGDTFCAFPIETTGTTTQAVVDHFRQVASAAVSAREGTRATRRQVALVLQTWCCLISLALMEGRARAYKAAQSLRIPLGAPRPELRVVAAVDRWAVGYSGRRRALAVQGPHIGRAAARGVGAAAAGAAAG